MVRGSATGAGVARSLRARKLLLAMILIGLSPRLAGAEDNPLPALPPGSEAVPIPEIQQRWPHLDDHQRLAVVVQLTQATQFDLAEKLLADVRPTSLAGQREARYLLGKLRKAQGRIPEAIAIFRALLAEDPKFTRARLELGFALYLMQQDESARHQFDLALGSVTNPELQKVVQKFIETMDERRLWNLSAYAGIASTTNINQAAIANTPYLGNTLPLNAPPQKQAATGIFGGVVGGYRQPISESIDMMFAGSAIGRGYRDNTFNDDLVTGELGPRLKFEWGNIGFYATTARRWVGNDPYAVQFGGRIAAAVKIDANDLLNANFACVRKDYDVATDYNGANCSAALTLDHIVDAKTFVRVMGGSEQETTSAQSYSYNAANIGLGLSHEFSGGMTLYGQLLATRRNYEAPFADGLDPRRDTRIDATLSITNKQWDLWGLSPMVQYTYTYNFSNVDLYKYDAHGLTLTLTKKF